MENKIYIQIHTHIHGLKINKRNDAKPRAKMINNLRENMIHASGPSIRLTEILKKKNGDERGEDISKEIIQENFPELKEV